MAWPLVAAAIGAAAAQTASTVGSSALSYAADRQSQLENLDAARDQRNWSQWMDSTKYQRMVADLRAAGLNPMLAYTQGASGAPSGAAGSTGSYSQHVSPVDIPSIISSATQAKRLQDLELEKLDAEKRNIDADTRQKDATTDLHLSDVPLRHAQTAATQQDIQLRALMAPLERDMTQAATRASSAQAMLHNEHTIGQTFANRMIQIDSDIKEATKSTEEFVKKYGWFWDEMVKLGKTALSVYFGFRAAGASQNFLRAFRDKVVIVK